MDIDESYFFTGELEDLILARSGPQPGLFFKEAFPDEAESFEGETLPESALQTIRSWFGL